MTNTRPNPYVGPRAFQTGEALYGRDRELNELIDLLVAERIVLLHSPSGAGKSSLIYAGLIPSLRQEGFNILPVMRLNQERPPELLKSGDTAGFMARYNRYTFSALLSLDEGRLEADRLPLSQLAATGLSAYLDSLTDSTLPEDETPGDESGYPLPAGLESGTVLIFDQFEEILTVDPTDREGKMAFFQQLGEALRPRSPTGRQRDRWALFAIREDYMGGLDPYLRPVPTRLANTYRLDLLGVEAALQAIQTPPSREGVLFAESAAHKLVDDLRKVQIQQPDGSFSSQFGQNIEPVQLQVVCYRLWENLPGDHMEISETDLATVGDVNQSLAEYYADSVEATATQTGIPERSIREWFDRQLITETGIRAQVLMEASASGDLDNRAIRPLVDAHLVRSEKRAGATWFELAHDRLIGPMRESNAAWFQANLSLLQRQASLWDEQNRPEGLLLSGQSLEEAEAWAQLPGNIMTGAEEDFLNASQEARRRARRERLRSRVIAILGVGALILAILAILLWVQSNANLDQARTQGTLAAGNAITATINEGLAKAGQGTANANEKLAQRSEATANYSATQAVLERDKAQAAEITALYNQQVAETQQAFAQAASTQAIAQQSTAVYNSGLAASRQIAFLAQNYFETNPSLAALLSAEAYKTAGTLESKTLLFRLNSASINSMQVDSSPLTTMGSEIWSIAYNPANGQQIAIGSKNGIIRLVNPDPTQNRDLRGHSNAVTGLAFSPDGTILYSGGRDNKILLRRLATDEFKPLTVENRIGGLALRPDGKQIAVSIGKIVRLYNIDPENLTLNTIPEFPDITAPSMGFVHDIAWSPDGKYLATGGEPNWVRVWDPTTGTAVFDNWFHKGIVWSLAWSPDSRYLASGSQDGALMVWDVLSGAKLLEQKRPHGGHDVYALSFSGDGLFLASGGWDETVAIWQMPNLNLVTRLDKHKKDILAVAFNPYQYKLLSGGTDKIVYQHELRSQDPLNHTIRTGLGKVTSLAAMPDGNPNWIHNLEGNYLVGEGELAKSEFADIPKVASTALSRDGQQVAFADQDGNIYLFKYLVDTLEPLWQTDIGNQEIWALAFSPDGKTIASSQCESYSPPQTQGAITCIRNLVQLWDLEKQTLLDISLLVEDIGAVKALAFHPTQPLIALGSDDGIIQIWNFKYGEKIILDTSNNPASITSLAYSPDGTMLVSGNQNGNLLLWDVANDYQLIGQLLAGSPGEVLSLAFDSLTNRLLVGGTGGTITAWSLDPKAWMARACKQAGRNLSQTEWDQFIKGRPFEKTCP